MTYPRVAWTIRLIALPLHITAMAALRVQGQAASRPVGAQWIVASDATTNLWFHSLAMLAVDGPGTLPFYDAGYARAVREEKARRGIAPSKLDRDADALRRAMMADSAFELLHFLPLYLDRMSPGDLPGFLRQAAQANPPALTPEDVVRAIRSSLSSRSERALLVDLADAIEDEWRTFLSEYSASRAPTDAARRRVLQARWDEAFAPRLAEVFRAIGAPGGILLVSPSLGPEGRVVNLGTAGMIVAVADRSDATTPDAPLLASIRELCFPLLRRIAEADASASAHAARGADESSRAAVRCGAQLVDSLMPVFDSAYRALFLSARPGESEAGYRRRFDRRFQTDAVTLRAVSEEIARLTSRAGGSTP